MILWNKKPELKEFGIQHKEVLSNILNSGFS